MSKKPAILLITCDELRRDTLSLYGNRAIRTPNIDSLAEQGVSFDRCYTVSPWCLPARCSILTGLYPHRSGAYSNFRKCPLDNGIPNVFTELRKSGYGTSLFGKCHFAPVPYGETRPDATLPYGEFRDYYMSLGIDHLELEDDKQVSVWFMDDYARELDKKGYLKAYRDAVWDGGKQKVFPFPGPAEYHPDAWVGGKAAQYIENLGEDEPSQFLWISFSGPHYPFDAPEEYLGRVDREMLSPRTVKDGELLDQGRIQHTSYYGGGHIDGCGPAEDHACKNYSEDYWERLRVSYNANVALIDDQVGRILAAAEKRFGDDCLVIFTADHGEMLGNHGLWGKHNCGYEEVWHIPLLVRFPGKGAPGITNALVNSNDILPTCLEAAGAEPIPCDGESFRQRMADGGLGYTFAEGEGYIAVTDGTYKYIHVQKEGSNLSELLDLRDDPHEFENRIGDPRYAADLARLRGKVLEHILPKVLP